MGQARNRFFRACSCCAAPTGNSVGAVAGQREFLAGGAALLAAGALGGLRLRSFRGGANPAASHRRASSCFAAAVARCGQEGQARQPAHRQLVGAEIPRRHGQGRHRDRGGLADHAAGEFPARQQGSGSAHRARIERIREENDGRPPRAVRHVRHAAASAHRREPQRDRPCLRYAQGGRHRHDDELRRQVARLSGVLSNLGGANRRKATVYTHPTARIAASTWCTAFRKPSWNLAPIQRAPSQACC